MDDTGIIDSPYGADLKQAIIALLRAEHATDLSDAEIARCTEYCASGLIGERTKMFCDMDFLTWDEVTTKE